MRIFAVRDDGAKSWTESTETGDFELSASDGNWNVYAANLNPYVEGEHVVIQIINGVSDYIKLPLP